MRCELFLPALAERPRKETHASEELEAALAAIEERARAANPGVEVAAATFFAYVAERVPADRPVLASLARMATDDIYLACACAGGDARAVARFDEILDKEVAVALAQVQIPGADLGDIKQKLRQRLLLADDRPQPYIVDYAGRGDLRAWVKVVAVRDALQIRRKLKREVLVEHAEVPLDEAIDPELREIKKMYVADFKDAFQASLRGLAARERNLLRHHFLHGLNIDEIGGIYGVHRATVARWIAKAREDLLRATRLRLMDKLNANSADVESIMALVKSNLDASISRLLVDD